MSAITCRVLLVNLFLIGASGLPATLAATAPPQDETSFDVTCDALGCTILPLVSPFGGAMPMGQQEPSIECGGLAPLVVECEGRFSPHASSFPGLRVQRGFTGTAWVSIWQSQGYWDFVCNYRAAGVTESECVSYAWGSLYLGTYTDFRAGAWVTDPTLGEWRSVGEWTGYVS